MKRSLIVCLLISLNTIPALAQRAKQPREVVEAYRVCQRFQQLMAEDLDFDRAFEATFTTNASRRREIAISELETSGLDLRGIDDASLIAAFKNRMQIFFLMLPLVSPGSKEEEAIFFPPEIKEIIERKAPETTAQFPAYSQQLKRDAAQFRAHLDRLAQTHPSVARRIREFKEETLLKKLEPPDHRVEPLTAYSNTRVLGVNKPYYQINEYAVIREGREMRIIGIRFLLRLF